MKIVTGIQGITNCIYQAYQDSLASGALAIVYYTAESVDPSNPTTLTVDEVFVTSATGVTTTSHLFNTHFKMSPGLGLTVDTMKAWATTGILWAQVVAFED
jgi:hypothetical protein